MSRKHAKLLRQAISREQRRPQPHGYCDDRTCAQCRAIDAWGVRPTDYNHALWAATWRPLCAVCNERHAMDAACVGVGA